MENFRLRQEVLCSWLWDREDNKIENINVIMYNIKKQYNFNENKLLQIENKIKNNFLPAYIRKWKEVRRVRARFEKHYTEFLNNYFTVEFANSSTVVHEIPQAHCSSLSATNVSISTKSRPRLSYEESSERSKRRRINEIRSLYSSEELYRATEHVHVHEESVHEHANEEEDEHFIDTVLAMYMDMEMTKLQYNTLRSYNQQLFGSKSYPPYPKIAIAKKRCYPEGIVITDRGASIEVQSLFDHTIRRLVSSLDPEVLPSLRNKTLVLYSKWGMDGATSQQIIQQKRIEQKEATTSITDKNVGVSVTVEQEHLSDHAVFVISFVPLQLSYNNEKIWVNDRPSSVRYCRPIKFQFTFETAENTLKEYNYYSEKMNDLRSTHVIVGDISFHVAHHLECTMIDGKTCNVLTNEKSSASCNICGARPSQMNDLQLVNSLPPKTNFYKFGLSTLHCKIRFMECLLHIAYNMDFKKSSARGEQNQSAKDKKKKSIQNALKESLGITVDVVKQGTGTTNTGNTARRFFAEPQVVANVCELDERLVTRFANILQAAKKLMLTSSTDMQQKQRNYMLNCIVGTLCLHPCIKS